MIRLSIGEPIGQNTEVSLHLKEDLRECSEQRRVKEAMKKHSPFIKFSLHPLCEYGLGSVWVGGCVGSWPLA